MLQKNLNIEYQYSTSGELLLKMDEDFPGTSVNTKGLSEQQVVELVADKRDWIAARLTQFDEVRHLLGQTKTARPQAFNLPALAESWRVEYPADPRQNRGCQH
jgi:hypothetical protein